MKLELKTIKYAAFASQETACFEAILHVDGKPFAVVSNEGHGGGDMVCPVKGPYNSPEFQAKLAEIDAHLKATVPADTSFGTTLECDLEIWCGSQLDEFLLVRAMRKALKKEVLVKKADGHIYGFKPKGTATVATIIPAIKQKFPDAIVLNEMAEADALALYRVAA